MTCCKNQGEGWVESWLKRRPMDEQDGELDVALGGCTLIGYDMSDNLMGCFETFWYRDYCHMVGQGNICFLTLDV